MAKPLATREQLLRLQAEAWVRDLAKSDKQLARETGLPVGYVRHTISKLRHGWVPNVPRVSPNLQHEVSEASA